VLLLRLLADADGARDAGVSRGGEQGLPRDERDDRAPRGDPPRRRVERSRRGQRTGLRRDARGDDVPPAGLRGRGRAARPAEGVRGGARDGSVPALRPRARGAAGQGVAVPPPALRIETRTCSTFGRPWSSTSQTSSRASSTPSRIVRRWSAGTGG